MEDRFHQITVKRIVTQSSLRGISETGKMGKPKSDQPQLILKERKSKRERWLLTRKTWRYMADAGRRLIPEGVHNRQEDVPKIEAYFQEVCQKEPKFLLWRKSSYPGAISLRTHSRRTRPRKKGGSCREKASSADEAEEIKKFGKTLAGGKMYMTPVGAGRFDLLRLSEQQKEAEDDLISELENFLRAKAETSAKKLNHQELFDKLQKYLEDVQSIQRQMTVKHAGMIIPEPSQKDLLETIKRHYRKSTNREAVISNLLTDRKLLEKLYFDLRKTRGFRASGAGYGLQQRRSGFFGSSAANRESIFDKQRRNEFAISDSSVGARDQFSEQGSTSTFQDSTVKGYQESSSSLSPEPTTTPPAGGPEPPKVIQITKISQTPKIHPDMMKVIEERMKKGEEEVVKAPVKDPPKTPRRRSSLDHDDVSPSVGDTIKRYLKMARKKSIDTDKKDRFKTINYDENLRNIKPKGETSTIGNDDGLHKGCQAGESWLRVLKDFKMEDSWVVKDHKEVLTVSDPRGLKVSDDSLASSSGSHAKSGLLSSGQMFLSSLLHGLQHTDKNTSLPTAMQKSKSSTSVGRNLVSKKIWRGRSKSQSRLSTTQPCSWTPQGNCVWSNLVGKQVTLSDTTILQLSEIERRVLQKVALAKLQALNIGCSIQIPSEVVAPTTEIKAKRRPHLLKRKAITTSFFDTNRGKDKEASVPTSSGGMVFGVPLGQCIENERLSRNASYNVSFKSKDSTTFPDDSDLELRRKSHHGSRTSFSSLIEPRPQDESAGSTESLGSRVPGLLDAISVGSTTNISSNTTENEPSVPSIVSACLRHIETHGLHTLGIFRVSSSKKRVRQLRESFDSGKEISLDECCPHDVATLLKEYFRDLPEPLLCKDLYKAFVLTQKLRNRKLQFEALQHLIQLLPVSNRDTLWSLLNFLSLVAANCDDHKNKCGETVPGNKMDSNNLATLFAPNILHCRTVGTVTKESLSAESCEERIDVINVIRSMIDHNKSLFQVSADLLDEVYLHMMDTHPEALDQLLRKREASEEVFEDPDSEVLEEIGTGSESSSIPQTPKTFAETEVTSDREERRTYSREQFLHEKSAFELFDVDGGSRSRDKDRSRVTTVRRTRRESTTRLVTDSRSSDSKYEDEDNHSSFLESSGILKASLTIPTSSFALNLDDSDIPYIEDSNNLTEGSKQQQSTQSTTRSRTSVGYSSNRYRSTNGSDASQTSQTMIPVSVQAVTGSFSYTQGTSGYDSAVGSSATFSSPPRYTATPSSCSSNDREYFSSPPSWGSSPPLSPDSHTSTMDDLSDDVPASTIGKISIPARTLTESVTAVDKDDSESEAGRSLRSQRQRPDKLKSSDVGKVQGDGAVTSTRQDSSKSSVTKELYQRVHSFVGGSGGQTGADTLTKSASSSQLTKKGEPETGESAEWSRKVTTSISNIGGAVMRSKTADIERMLKIKPEVKKVAAPAAAAATTTTTSASKVKSDTKTSSKSESDKKYSRRRYTDSRHPTRQIPDMSDKPATSLSSKTQSIWKRREIISSPPKHGEDS